MLEVPLTRKIYNRFNARSTSADLGQSKGKLLWLSTPEQAVDRQFKVGERRVIYLYSALILALEFVIWFTPSLILNAVSVSIVGLLLG